MYSTLMQHHTKRGVGIFNYQGSHFYVFSLRGGIKKAILNQSFDWFFQMILAYSRLSVTFIQLHTKTFTESNRHLSEFNRELRRQLKQRYNCKVGIFWVRERDSSLNQHYHLAIGLSGHVNQSSFHVCNIARRIWSNISSDHTDHFPKNRHYLFRRSDRGYRYRAALMRLSYFAKARTKEANIKGKSYGYSFS